MDHVFLLFLLGWLYSWSYKYHQLVYLLIPGKHHVAFYLGHIDYLYIITLLISRACLNDALCTYEVINLIGPRGTRRVLHAR